VIENCVTKQINEPLKLPEDVHVFYSEIREFFNDTVLPDIPRSVWTGVIGAKEKPFDTWGHSG